MSFSRFKVSLGDCVELDAGTASPFMNCEVKVLFCGDVDGGVVKAHWHTFREDVNGRVIGWLRLGAVHQDRRDPFRTNQTSNAESPRFAS